MGGQCVKINEDIFEYLPEGREEGRQRWVYGNGMIGLSLNWWVFGSLEPGSNNIPTRATAGARSRGVNRQHGKIQIPPLV